jgi:uncharacterized protein YcfJ
MKTIIKFLLIFTAAVSITGPVFAGHKYTGKHRSPGFDARAKVTRVVPIIETVEIAVPHQVCRIERLHHTHYRHHSNTPEIVGSIVGGLLGSQIGRGGGRTAATIAGVVLGGSIAHDLTSRSIRRTPYGRNVEVCETRYSYRYEERITGYRVSYRHRGKIYQTRREHHPGTHISILVRN